LEHKFSVAGIELSVEGEPRGGTVVAELSLSGGRGSTAAEISGCAVLGSCAGCELTLSAVSLGTELSLKDGFCNAAMAALRSEGQIVILAYGGT